MKPQEFAPLPIAIRENPDHFGRQRSRRSEAQKSKRVAYHAKDESPELMPLKGRQVRSCWMARWSLLRPKFVNLWRRTEIQSDLHDVQARCSPDFHLILSSPTPFRVRRISFSPERIPHDHSRARTNTLFAKDSQELLKHKCEGRELSPNRSSNKFRAARTPATECEASVEKRAPNRKHELRRPKNSEICAWHENAKGHLPLQGFQSRV